MSAKQGLRKAAVMLALCVGIGLLGTAAIAQSAASTKPLPAYDLAKELKIQGTVRMISTRSDPSSGLPGTHLMLRTPRGVVDAHLGSRFAVKAEHVRLRAGQTVEVTGMMTRYNGNPILVVRILTTSSHIYVLRDEQGMPVRALTPDFSPVSAPPLEEGL